MAALREGIRRFVGLAVYIALESPISGLNHIEMVNGKFVGQYWEELCQIAEKIGVKPPCEFSSTSRDELVDLIGEDVKVEPQLQWFDPHSGLASIRSLQRWIGEKPSHFSVPVADDLATFEEILARACQRNVRFRFTFDF
jgi:hypothetical protein